MCFLLYLFISTEDIRTLSAVQYRMDLNFYGTKLLWFSFFRVFRVFIFADASSLTLAILRTMTSSRSKMDVPGNSLAL